MGMLRKIGILGFVLLLTVITLNSAFAAEVEFAHLFDCNEGSGGTLIDSTGRANGTVNGMTWNSTEIVPYNTTGDGGPFSCEFDGAGYVELDNLTWLNDTAQHFAASVWIKPDANTGNILSFWDNTAAQNEAFQLWFVGGGIQCLARDAAHLSITATSADNIALDRWTLVICQWDGVNLELIHNTTLQAATGKGSSDLQSLGDLGRNAGGANFFNGVMDDIKFYNSSLNSSQISNLFNFGDVNGTAPPLDDSINVSAMLPANNTQHNTLLLNINVTVNATNTFNATLFVDGVANQTRTGFSSGTNVPVSFNLSFSSTEERELSFFLTVFDNQTQENTSNHSIFIDNVVPVITILQSPQNNTAFKSILDGQFNFTDSFLLFSYEVFVDGTLIDLQTELNTTAFAYNLTANVTTLASDGQHILTINISDGHTARDIGEWDYDRNIFTKRIRYKFGDSYISIYATDANLADSFDTIKQKDRYQFVHKRARKSSIETYRITSDKKISIIEGYEEYQGWIVINDLKKWIDFNNVDGAKSKVTRVDDYTVEVTTTGIKSQDIVFNSIGSLNTVTETFSFFKGNLTHNIADSTFENEIISFEIVFNTNDSLVQDIQANLFWNGTNEGFDTQINGTNQVNFSKIFTVPQVDSDQIVEVFWNYTITGTENIEINTTDIINQTVFNFNFSICDETDPTVVLKLITLNEEDDSVISNVSVEAFFTFFVESGFVSPDNATKINASFVFPLAQNYSVCLTPFNETLVTDADIDYDTQGFSQRNFFLRKVTLGNNITKTLNLYLINSSIATTVEINVVDNEDQPKVNVFIKVLRRFIGNNSFKEVEVAKTDDDGSTVVRLVLNDEFYKFVIQEDNVTIFTSTERKILSSQIFIRIGELAEFLETINKVDNLEFTLTNTTLANGSVDFTFFFNDLENIVREGCLRVRAKGIVDTEICETCSSAASATITCIAPNTTNSILVATAFIDSNTRNSQFVIAVLEIDFLSEFRNFGQIGVYLSLLIMSVMIGVAIWTPTGAMVFGTIAVLASYGMGLIGLSYGTIIGIVAMVIYIIASRRN